MTRAIALMNTYHTEGGVTSMQMGGNVYRVCVVSGLSMWGNQP